MCFCLPSPHHQMRMPRNRQMTSEPNSQSSSFRIQNMWPCCSRFWRWVLFQCFPGSYKRFHIELGAIHWLLCVFSLQEFDFHVRWPGVKLLTALLKNQGTQVQGIILVSPMGESENVLCLFSSLTCNHRKMSELCKQKMLDKGGL